MNQPDDLALLYRDIVAEITDNVCGELKRLNRETIEEVQRTKRVSDPVDMAKCYARLRIAKEAIEKELTQINKTFEVLKGKDFPTICEDRGVPNVPLNDPDIMKTVSPKSEVYAKMVDKHACANWLRTYVLVDENGDPVLDHEGDPVRPYRDLITETVNANTLSATARELAKKGQEFPATYKDKEGNEYPMFETGTRDSTGWRKITPKL